MSINAATAIEDFMKSMQAEGIDVDDEIIADGKLHRYHAIGDKAGSKNAWGVLHLDKRPAGQFGCLKRFGERKFSWRADYDTKPMSAADLKAQREDWARRKAEQAAAANKRHADAAQRAQTLWNAAQPAPDNHPYLVRKGVKAHGLRMGVWEMINKDTGEVWPLTQKALYVPLCDKTRAVHSLQGIFPGKILGKGEGARDKDYLKDGAKRGLFHAIGKPQKFEGRPVFIICEGYATGASIHEVTNHLVLVAFDTSNLLAVGEAIRESKPDAIILFAADNDQWTTAPVANPGLTHAKAAAKSVAGLVALPPFAYADGKQDADGKWSGPTDFNDAVIWMGAKAVSEIFEEIIRNGDVSQDERGVPFAEARESVADDMVMPDYIDEVALSVDRGEVAVRGTGQQGLPSHPLQKASAMPIGADARDGVTGTFPLTEVGNCYRVVATHGSNIRFVPELKAWLHWSGENWLWDMDGSRLRGMVCDLARVIYDEGSGQMEQAQFFLRWARESQKARTIKNAATLLEDVTALRLQLSTIDGDPMLVGLDRARKVLDMGTGLCREARREDYVTRSLGPNEIGDSSKAVGWKKFVDEIFMGDIALIAWVKRYIGYTLTGRYNEQIFVFAHGSGSNGKSVLIKTLQQLSGEYSRTVASTTLMEQRRGASDASPDVAALAGARLLLSSETSAGSVFDEEFLKGWTGGDTQNARHLYRDTFSFEPVGKLFIAGNYRPRISGTDHAIWRRVRLLPFQRKFSDEEKDTALPEKLAAELPHILAWAMEGCLDWQREGLSSLPKVMNDASKQYAAEQDILGEFLAESTTEGPVHECTSQELFDAYREWMSDCNLRPSSRQAFGRQLGERGFKARHTNKGNVYRGLMLSSPL
ncbi:phage/plasmid primase, P4 family [Pseudomonas sp. UYIF39]|uniref:phage/plasmid primase, P4 family n=1 Tax=Pseudomonas sp. UYIF39 TaxID=1630747 RepID=UPI00249EEAFE|nr:phage/plasmid primase, P4 family [Pseudomonas sp. UYIF39]MDI3356277.1 phage/plasmid primase, P4 family [Pseudomonas sp. UYIF39]